ncbi:30S ribosomal protein S4 [Candidatus Gracilibacteria bacterium]|nr:30S ribosomal protein S4 [Candidatus Gracilibacteria bacterium]
MRDTGPKMKLCRREGYNLFGTEKYNLENNNRQVKRGRKLSEFGMQLRKKQAAKRQYHVSEKQFVKYYKKATKVTDVTTGEAMIRLLELRLDNVVLRANFARTIMQARQSVNHGHFHVNGKKQNIPSYQVKIGDVISLKEKMKESPLYKTLIDEFQEFSKKNSDASLTSVKWMKVDPKNLTITITALPEKSDFDKMIDIPRIIQFYSK